MACAVTVINESVLYNTQPSLCSALDTQGPELNLNRKVSSKRRIRNEGERGHGQRKGGRKRWKVRARLELPDIRAGAGLMGGAELC